LLRLAASAEWGSEHPLGEAIVRRAREEGLEVVRPEQFTAEPGRGIQAEVEGHRVLVGSAGLLSGHGVTPDGAQEDGQQFAREGKTPMFVAVDGRPAGVVAVADTLKPKSREVVTALRAMGLDVVMMTGDNRLTAEAIAKQVGIEHVLAEVLPDRKADEVKALQAAGRRVAMVGDGINDAPALAAADVGIAMSTGTDVAMHAAGVTLMRGEPALVADAIDLSRRTFRKIRQNLFWAFIYNLVGIPLAALGLLSPVVAGAAMAFSSVSVISNALLLRRWTPTHAHTEGSTS
ncbi:MAG: HAD-IC family P-type ATPase, partial [Noviherbaspirillum sp.]